MKYSSYYSNTSPSLKMNSKNMSKVNPSGQQFHTDQISQHPSLKARTEPMPSKIKSICSTWVFISFMMHHSVFFIFFMSLSLPHLAVPSETQNPHHLCLNQERSALLEFKQSFTIDTSRSKTSSWMVTDDCCSWDGVECDEGTGHVIELDLEGSFLGGSLPANSTLFHLLHLQRLNLGSNHLSGNIPAEIMSLTQLTDLLLGSNQLTGQIPSHVTNLTRLRHLDLSLNRFRGTIPNSFPNLKNLQSLDLYSNNLSGTVDLDMFHNLEALSTLDVSRNNLSLLVHSSFDLTKQYEFLGFASCRLVEFPAFLHNQNELVWLDLSDNEIHGEVPKWVWNSSVETLDFFNVSHNSLTGFGDQPIVLPWTKLRTLDISFNTLRGPLPIPPHSTNFYLVSNNRMTGQLSPPFCGLSALIAMDVSYNNLTGTVPKCLGRLGKSLSILNLQGNNFSGEIPQPWMQGCALKMINLSENQFERGVPRSLRNCTRLEFMDLGLNQLHGTFPYWLGAHPELRVICLRHNRLYGAIDINKNDSLFRQLRILDLSFNNFSGNLPTVESQYWDSMKKDDVDEILTYMQIQLLGDSRWVGSHSAYYDFSMKVTNKGMERVYRKIPNIFRGIDLSNNRFEGEIPTSFENLRGLHLLSLGGNRITGNIPPSLGHLMGIESLDLSDNELVGDIPRGLMHLTSLSFFNVSYNNLEGSIPRGNQFDTFENSSYEGNAGLCGDPLTRKCIDLEMEPTQPSAEAEEEEDDSGFFGKVELIVIFTGFAGGLVVGVILGHEFVERNLIERLLNILGRRRRSSDTYSRTSYFSSTMYKIWR